MRQLLNDRFTATFCYNIRYSIKIYFFGVHKQIISIRLTKRGKGHYGKCTDIHTAFAELLPSVKITRL